MDIPGPLLIALLILVGSVGGWIAVKLRLPALFGQVMAGVILGQTYASEVLHHSSETFEPFSMFALSLVAVTIGGHLEFKRLRNAKKRILLISATQLIATFFAVFWAMHFLNPLGLPLEMQLPAHLLMASIATSTSPVSTIHLVREQKAKGLLVKTTIAVLAVSNLMTLVLFEVIRAFDLNLLAEHRMETLVFAYAGAGIAIALAIGGISGIGLVRYCRYHLGRKGERKIDPVLVQAELFTAFLVTIFFCNGLCEWITLHSTRQLISPSPILANIMLGLVLANRSSFKEDLLSLFNVLEHAVFTMFYVLAGSHLQLGYLKSVGVAAGIFFLVRLVGKVGGGWIGGLLSATTPKVSRNIGWMLTAQGAIAVSLVILLEQYEVFEPIRGQFTAAVLTAVVLAELTSAPVISCLLKRVGETEKDRTRLIEFLQEEYILPRVKVKGKRDALEQLVSFLCHTHAMKSTRDQVMQAILKREESMPTGIGHGIAVPHAIIPEGDKIVGVLGLLEPPVDFGAPDGEPARLVILIATPESQKRRHLEVIAAITRMLRDDHIRSRLYEAESSEEIHEIIDSEEAETFNYFLTT
ncbi:MAG: PTS sugar transporter subunit IIA [Kiritimatiellia bacterium]